MKAKNQRIVVAGMLLAALSLVTNNLFAGTSSGKDFKETPAAPPQPFTDVTLTSSYVFGSDFVQGDGRFGSQAALNNEFEATYHAPFNGNWFFVIGAGYGRRDFSLANAPLPSHLQDAEGIIGIEYRQNGNLGFLFETRPGVYFANNVTGDSFDAPTVLAAAWEVTDRFALIGGVSFAALRKYQFLPVVGARWTINDQWTLRLVLPDPRLIYKPTDKLELWAGGELTGGSYRTDRRNIDPQELSGAQVTYYETRVGAGMTWKPCQCASVELGAGYALQRTFDFNRPDMRYDLEPAPYVGGQISLRF